MGERERGGREGGSYQIKREAKCCNGSLINTGNI